MKPEAWQAVIDINLSGVFYASKVKTREEKRREEKKELVHPPTHVFTYLLQKKKRKDSSTHPPTSSLGRRRRDAPCPPRPHHQHGLRGRTDWQPRTGTLPYSFAHLPTHPFTYLPNPLTNPSIHPSTHPNLFTPPTHPLS